MTEILANLDLLNKEANKNANDIWARAQRIRAIIITEGSVLVNIDNLKPVPEIMKTDIEKADNIKNVTNIRND